MNFRVSQFYVVGLDHSTEVVIYRSLHGLYFNIKRERHCTFRIRVCI